ncbi:hypothetical protein [Dehalogenimonas etheniformans]|uniref:Terminase large subunit gp17-like C-terminal domain-containing protein n=1 Tax=Dehalogenimonas etheniformans TaxID=1536648 RepID=A0A2P5P826_9CHLR|nr:hypothetical protein [Dehalogenimonas etheniformans]PPD58436.1 hypothetical protein JP09_004130 [Dehalogenimonas etheniformans]QNT75880.1 hypothetical protein HX448_03845 [Dehalogenimonas etheniformans]
MTAPPETIEALRPYQSEILKAVTTSVRDGLGLTFSVEIARQGGKNELSAWIETWALVHNVEQPLNIVKCAPTFEPQAMISLRRLCSCLDSIGFGGDYVIEAGHIVRLGQARVIFLSANENANVVGNTAHLLLEIDEAQDVSIDKFDRDFRPMAATRNATTILFGTPWREGNLLDTIKSRNLELERADGIKRHFRFDWEEVGRYNDNYRVYVEGERDRLGENHPTFRTQYQLLEVGKGGGFFSDDYLMKMTGDYPRELTAQPRAVYVAGLDFGGEGNSASDSTVLTIAEVEASSPSPLIPLPQGARKMLRIVQHYAWTGLPFTILLPKIIEIARAWGLRRIAADATGLGAPLCATLKTSLGHRVVPVVFTTHSKSEMGYELLAAAGAGRLQLYSRDASTECQECWQELENASADYRPNQSLNFYCAPSRSHDDYLISLALVVKAASKYEPRAAVGRVA